MNAAANDIIWLNQHPQKTALVPEKIISQPRLCAICRCSSASLKPVGTELGDLVDCIDLFLHCS